MSKLTESIIVGKKAQITIPKGIRESLGIEEGEELYITVVKNAIIIIPKPKSILGLGGIGKGLYGKDFIESLRSEWL